MSWGLPPVKPDIFAATYEPAGAAPSGSAWQPISTAPKDGSAFRAYGLTLIDADFNPYGSVEACFDGERFIGAAWDGQFDCWNTVPIEFTHWMPLPPGPLPGSPET